MILTTFKGSIENRLRMMILLVVFFTGSLGYGVYVFWNLDNQQQRTAELSKSIGLVVSQDFAKLILLNQVSVASDITSKLKSFASLHSLVLYSKEEVPLYQYHKDDISFVPDKLPSPKLRVPMIQDNRLKLYLKEEYEGIDLGSIEFVFEINSLWEIFKKDSQMLVALSLFMFLVSYILAAIFARRFTAPILKLVSFLEKVELSSSLNQKIETNEENEFGKLYNEVNIMLDRIHKAGEVQRLASVAFETQNGMIITDAKQKILQVNKSFTKITGYEPHEVLGKTPAVLKSGYQTQTFYDDMWHAIQKNHYWNGEIFNRHKTGDVYPELLTIQSVLDEKQTVLYYVASFLDLSTQKAQENSIKEKENLLLQQSKMASMGEMLENIAHQWRQPLSMITTTSSGLRMQKELEILSDEDFIDGLQKIQYAASHLSQTIDDFRNFLKEDAKESSFSIKDALNKALMLVSSKFKNRNIQIVTDENDCFILGFENELIQVFMNILNNANDAFEISNVFNRMIQIKITKSDDAVKISINDSAGGIPEEILPKIFEHKFTTKEHLNGTGIGLYMSQLIVVKAKGKIRAYNNSFEVNNEVFFGACFEITFNTVVQQDDPTQLDFSNRGIV